MNGTFLNCQTPHGGMDLYVSCKDSQKKLPVVIVLMEAFGVNPHIRSICDRLSEEGFFAVAPDFFHRIGKRIEIPYGDRKLIMPYLGQLKNEDIVSDVREAISFLKELPTADASDISTMGFCIGGFASVLCSTSLPVKRMVSFYGAGMVRPREGVGLEPFLSSMGSIKSRCLFFFGGKDSSIPLDDIYAIEQKLTVSEVPFEVNLFPLSDHGFFCDERKSFNPRDAEVAWQKVLGFLKS